jgi:H+/Cl- antiporter ClcA
MKNYWKHFSIPFIILGIVSILFLIVVITQYIPEGGWNKGSSQIIWYLAIVAAGLAVVVTAVYVFVTKPKADKRTTTEKTFLGCQIMKESRDVPIK